MVFGRFIFTFWGEYFQLTITPPTSILSCRVLMKKNCLKRRLSGEIEKMIELKKDKQDCDFYRKRKFPFKIESTILILITTFSHLLLQQKNNRKIMVNIIMILIAIFFWIRCIQKIDFSNNVLRHLQLTLFLSIRYWNTFVLIFVLRTIFIQNRNY